MRLPALKVPELVKILVELERSGAAPFVELQLSHGRSLPGFVIEADFGGAPSLVLAGVDGHGRRTDELSYLSLADVVAVTVRNAADEALKKALSRGQFDALQGREPPGRLQLTRHIVQASQELTAALGASLAVKIDDRDLTEPKRAGGLDELLTNVREIFTTYAASADTAAAVTSRVQIVQLRHGPSKAVSIDAASKTLNLTMPFDGGLNDRFTKAELERELNRLL